MGGAIKQRQTSLFSSYTIKTNILDKPHIVYLYNGILFSHKKNAMLIHAITWMNLENIMLSEKSETQMTVFCMIPFI